MALDAPNKTGSIHPLGDMQTMLFIPEGNAHRLITHSKLLAAEQFKRWGASMCSLPSASTAFTPLTNCLLTSTCLSRFCRTRRKNAPVLLSFLYLDETEKQLGGKNYYGE